MKRLEICLMWDDSRMSDVGWSLYKDCQVLSRWTKSDLSHQYPRYCRKIGIMRVSMHIRQYNKNPRLWNKKSMFQMRLTLRFISAFDNAAAPHELQCFHPTSVCCFYQHHFGRLQCALSKHQGTPRYLCYSQGHFCSLKIKNRNISNDNEYIIALTIPRRRIGYRCDSLKQTNKTY